MVLYRNYYLFKITDLKSQIQALFIYRHSVQSTESGVSDIQPQYSNSRQFGQRHATEKAIHSGTLILTIPE